MKPNSPLFDPLIPTPEKEEKQREEEGKELDQTRSHNRLIPPSPLYIASYKEEVPTLVNNLVPEATPEEKMNTDRTEEHKMAENRGDSENNTDEDIGEDNSDSDFIY